ncbi:N-acetylmuramoyl-L-alanine amidase [Christensenellaceae bacterium NSJ-63]|uniref:N-acetylmuramoyl-L-alanine amidase n=1 Tax=Guopingia tenuis TaxID=2763656 RepID=A0A926DHD7_9FIRM|nr:N-acetylmuramoyl-L-alanine amidase [Guopingia tenuis]MBC8538153.1 N-acetylmuramoyl-L-alanine amidase [Guopingia tenuis]
MKKKFLAVCALVIMSVFVVSVYASAAPAIGTGICTAKSRCSIRLGAGIQFKKAGTLPAKANVPVYQQSGKWYQISYQNKLVWVHGDYLRFTSNGSSSVPAPSAAIGTGICTAKSWCNIRTGAGTQFKKAGTLPAKANVPVYQQSGKWYQISYQNKLVWVHGDYLKVTLNSTPKPDPQPETPAQAIGSGVCTAKSWCNIRTGAGTQFKKAGTLPAKANVPVYQQSGKWYQISYQNKLVWVHGDYLKVTLNSTPKPDPDPSPVPGDSYDAFPVAANSRLKGKAVILDPGHGVGAGGSYGSYKEHEHVLSFANYLKQNLERSGATVIMTRTSSANVFNYNRVSLANKYSMEVLESVRQRDLAALKTQETSLSQALAAQQNALLASEQELARLETLAGNSSQELSALNDSIAAKTREAEEKHKAMLAKREEMEAADPADTDLLEALQDELNQLSGDWEALKEEESDLLEQKALLEEDIASLPQKQEEARRQKESAAETLRELEKQSQSLAEEIRELSETIAELQRLQKVMASVISNNALAETYYDTPYASNNGRVIHPDLKKIFEYQKDPALDHIIYISIHTNATGDGETGANGTVTYYMSSTANTAYYRGYDEAANKRLAQLLLDQVSAAGKFNKRGNIANDFFMNRETNLPSALVEIGFHTNASDRAKLTDAHYQKRVANGMLAAIYNYFGV